jgi:ribosomal protein L7Ae-like RNA K-turn-binding protein
MRERSRPGAGRPPERVLTDLLGLAARARALVSGTDATRAGAREGSVRMVVLAADASPTQAAKLLPLLEARGIPRFTCLTRTELGAAIGRDEVSAVGLTDPNFARRAAELAAAITPPQD